MKTKTQNSKKFETKLINNFEIKSLDEAGRFSGYASVFNIEDSYKDIILPNAFEETLRERDVKKNVKLLWQHSAEEPIGFFDVIKEDNVGLYVEGKILLDVDKGKEAYSLIKNGAISGLSIGYNVKKAKHNSQDGTRIISAVDLWEISVVTFPANKYSNITFCKNYNPVSETKAFKNFSKNLDRAIVILGGNNQKWESGK